MTTILGGVSWMIIGSTYGSLWWDKKSKYYGEYTLLTTPVLIGVCLGLLGGAIIGFCIDICIFSIAIQPFTLALNKSTGFF